MTTDTMTDIDRDVFRVAARSNDAHAAITRLTDDATAAMMAHVDMARADVVRLTKELADAREELQGWRKLDDAVATATVNGVGHFTTDVAAIAIRAEADQLREELGALSLMAATLRDEALGLRGELVAERERTDLIIGKIASIASPEIIDRTSLFEVVDSVANMLDKHRDEAAMLRSDLAAASREIERLKEGEEHLVAGAAAFIAAEAATKKPRKAKEPVDLGPGPFVIMRNDAHGRRFWGYLDGAAGVECGWLALDGAKAFDVVADAEGFKPNRSKVVGLDEARRLLAADAGGGDADGGNVAPDEPTAVIADEPETCALCGKVRCGCTVEIGPAIDDRDTVTTDDRVEVETVDADDDSWAR